MSKVIVVGGGAAGMMAAVFAAENGHHVQIYDKNDRLGRKLFITGKGRCNIASSCFSKKNPLTPLISFRSYKKRS